MPDYETVIFDFDGTLIDSAPGIEYSLLESIRLILPEVVMELPDIRAHIGPPLPELVKQLLPEATPEVADRIESRFRSIYDDTGWQQTRVYKNVRETLSWLVDRGIGCFLVTNKRLRPTRQILTEFGLLPFFREVVSADANLVAFQSKEAIVRYLIEKHLLNPAKTLMVGDTSDDAAAAQMCGMNFAVAAYGYGNVHTHNEWLKDYILHNLSDLLEIVSGTP